LGITPLFAVISAFVLAKIADDLFGWRIALVTFVVWLAYPPLFINASYIFTSDTVALTFALLALRFFLQYWRHGRRDDLLWMCAAFGASAIMRYPNLLMLIFLGAALLIARRITWRDAMLGALVVSPFILTVLIFNRIVYGWYTVTGFHLGAELIAETANFREESFSFFKFRPEVIEGYIRAYVIDWPIMLVPQIVGLGYGVWTAWRRPALRAPLFVLFIGTAALIAYYLPQDAWGWNTPQVNASILRYLLPALALWTVFLVAMVLGWSQLPVIVRGFALAGLVGMYGWTSWSGPAGVQQVYGVVDRIQEMEERIVPATEPDALIAVRIMDKVIFPDRQTLTMTYLLDNEEPIDKGRKQTYQFIPDAQRFADVAVRVFERGIPLYLLADFDWRVAKRYDAVLRTRGFRLRHLKEVYPGFYKVVRLETEAESS
jgi:hypothetical protein